MNEIVKARRVSVQKVLLFNERVKTTEDDAKAVQAWAGDVSSYGAVMAKHTSRAASSCMLDRGLIIEMNDNNTGNSDIELQTSRSKPFSEMCEQVRRYWARFIRYSKSWSIALH